MSTLSDHLQPLLHAVDGPLTRDLLLEPGRHGLGLTPSRTRPDATTKSVCGYCSTGCSLDIHLKSGEAVNLSPTTAYPVNLGMACPKGWEALTVLDAPDRATTPLLRNASGQLAPVDWPTALDQFVKRFQKIQKQHGPHSVAFLSTGQIPTEEMAFLGALAKFGMGMRHGDGNTRQCMASAVVAYKQSFGFDAPPYTYADFEESDVLVFVGANPCLAHPIMWERVMRNLRSPEIVVIDPRRTETAMAATQQLAIAPKSDQTLFYGLARLLIQNGWIDSEFVERSTSGFEEFARFVEPFDLDRVCQETRLERRQIEQLAETIHERGRSSFWWTMGVNQSHQGVRTAQAMINVALLTGNIGRPGTGANSITGQCNAMGSRLFSNTTGLLGGRDFTNAEDRAEVARILEIDEDRIPQENSWAYNEIIEGILRGKIKGLWVICTNPAHSWINQSAARDILDRLDFLVVQDMYHTTETARRADLVLPAAGWGEKEGTFINSERRIGTIKKVHRAPGQALADFQIFRLIAQAWGCGEMFRKWTSPAAVFEMLKELSRGRPCDFSGINDYAELDRRGGIQWPSASESADDRQERRLFEDGRFFHPDGRAKFVFESPRPMSELPTEHYPFLLLTGRGAASQWHTQTRTAKSAVLRKLAPEEAYVEINPADAKALKIEPNSRVCVASQRGQMRALAVLTPSVRAGSVFVPMHYEGTNRLTDAVFDPYSKQPAYKSCAVRVTAE
ncbi:MAG TPA: nitrate reductase [Caulifigura sp.]|nr:nitrate reductase [Caulifigura sp.]